LKLNASKKLGQCFLVDDAVAEQIAETLDLSDKNVLEIGAGTGQLTAFLALRAKRVTAIEVDSKLIPGLKASLSSFDNVAIICADALKTSFNGYDAIFGNIPYSLSTPLLLKILESNAPAAVLLLQKEFAERLAAKPGDKQYSRLSILAQNSARIKLVAEVPPQCFSPTPRVSSAIVLLEKKAANEKRIFDEQLVSALFQHKNQTVSNALIHAARQLGLSKQEARKKAGKLSLKNKRPRELTLDQLEQTSQEWLKARPLH